MKPNLRIPLIGITAHHAIIGLKIESAVQSQLVSYLKALMGAGGAPVLVPLGLKEAGLRAVFERLDGLVLPGGPDVDPAHFGETPHEKLGRVDPALDHTELRLTRWALADDLPLLAICRGIQVLNVALGGSLIQDIPAQLPQALEHHRFRQRGYPPDDRAHPVAVEPNSRLATALGAERVVTNSRHHQAVKALAPGLSAVAHTADGLIEGVELPDARFAIGVQWHPENLVTTDPAMHRLFETFVRAAQDGKTPPS
jgi:putative glutamine amidotransferase